MNEISNATRCMFQMALHNYAMRVVREGEQLADWNSQTEAILKLASDSKTLMEIFNGYSANGRNILMIVPGKDTAISVQGNNSQGGLIEIGSDIVPSDFKDINQLIRFCMPVCNQMTRLLDTELAKTQESYKLLIGKGIPIYSIENPMSKRAEEIMLKEPIELERPVHNPPSKVEHLEATINFMNRVREVQDSDFLKYMVNDDPYVKEAAQRNPKWSNIVEGCKLWIELEEKLQKSLEQNAQEHMDHFLSSHPLNRNVVFHAYNKSGNVIRLTLKSAPLINGNTILMVSPWVLK